MKKFYIVILIAIITYLVPTTAKASNIVTLTSKTDFVKQNEPIKLASSTTSQEEIISSQTDALGISTFLSDSEKYTEEKVETSTIEIARVNLNSKVDTAIEEEKARKEEEERIKNMPDVNGIKLATAPITGTITSRYGVSSSIRSSRHTGLDIAATKGTPIKVVADGTVTFARYNGSYGYLVKVNHGNGVETWYAHTSKMYVTVGQEVKAGDVIALVGSTGNSTGPHLHFEIRINGEHVNPQNYLYK